MEDGLLHEIFGVSKSYRSTATEVRRGGVFVVVEPLDKRFICPECRSRDVMRKGKRIRSVQTLPIGFHPVYLEVAVPRCQCNRCQHLFEIAPPLCPAYAHYTKTLSRFVYGLSRVMTLSDVATLTRWSWDTVKAITKTHLAKDYGQPALRGVRYLGRAEIHLGKQTRFDTMVIDWEDGRILWAKPGRGQAALQGFWRRWRRAKTQIKAVAIDMSGAYWSAVLEHWPEAALVFDKFHMLKLMNERLDDLRREMGRAAEGPLKLKIKGPRLLRLRHPKNSTADQIPKLDEALHLNEPLWLAGYLKEELRELWSQPSRKQRAVFLKDGGDKAGQTGIGPMLKLAKTLRTHAAGILTCADHPITRGKLEGINNKIKTLTQRS